MVAKTSFHVEGLHKSAAGSSSCRYEVEYEVEYCV